ncbi:acyl transferase/acyl hydrolase/lysophospholipase [Mycena crocata]|nr:acyl transferase/acyl hydrolase/lysophospholipase [Mycena crocata]
MDDVEMPSVSGLRLLSLDGGGIRGLSGLLTLQTLMHRIQAESGLEKPPLPCDYFDLIGGTNTGGCALQLCICWTCDQTLDRIIAIMLGRLRMPVDQAIQCYDDMSSKIFRKSNLLGDGKYSASTMEKVIKAIVKDRTGDSETPLVDDGALGGKCRTFVCSMNALNMDARKPVLFRSYRSPKQVPIPCTIWQAARATSAAPTFFERILIGPASRPEPFLDGGLGRNNPAEELLSEAQSIFPGRAVASLVSIGTGQSSTIQVPPPGVFASNAVPVGLIKAMIEMAHDCEEIAERMEKRFEDQPKVYFRFNVDRGLQTVELDDWDRMNEVAAHTRQYMAKHEADKRLDDAVTAVSQKVYGFDRILLFDSCCVSRFSTPWSVAASAVSPRPRMRDELVSPTSRASPVFTSRSSRPPSAASTFTPTSAFIPRSSHTSTASQDRDGDTTSFTFWPGIGERKHGRRAGEGRARAR